MITNACMYHMYIRTIHIGYRYVVCSSVEVCIVHVHIILYNFALSPFINSNDIRSYLNHIMIPMYVYLV